jgi:hypothetical protein
MEGRATFKQIFGAGAAAVILLLSITGLSAQGQALTPTQLYGCWRNDAPQKIGESRIAFSIMCFRRNGTLHYSTTAPEGVETSNWIGSLFYQKISSLSMARAV